MGLSISKIQVNPIAFKMAPKKDLNSENKPIYFGYSNVLKTLYKKGKLPSVQKDVFGNQLTMKTVTLDHIIPKSQGGSTSMENLTLMDKKANNDRGTRPLLEMITVKQLKEYCDQFINIKLPNFNGKQYVKGILKTLGLIQQ